MKEFTKKKILFLNKIKERELNYPLDKNSEDEAFGGWDLDNWDFELPVKQFETFILELNRLEIIDLIDRYHVPEFVKNQKAHNEDGELISSDELVFFYRSANLEKLEKYLKTLLPLFTSQEIAELNKPRPIKTRFGEVLKQGAGLTLYKGGLITYQDEEIDLRTGLKDLCEIFMDRPNQLLDRNTLIDEIGIRTKDPKNTVAKYVSALNIALEPRLGRQPIENHKKEGWIWKT